MHAFVREGLKEQKSVAILALQGPHASCLYHNKHGYHACQQGILEVVHQLPEHPSERITDHHSVKVTKSQNCGSCVSEIPALDQDWEHSVCEAE